jgi:hypothetical protein
MGHQVRTHTRRLPSGRTVTVRQHSRQDDGAGAPVDAPLSEKDQDRRDRFERRAQRERQAQERRALREQHEHEQHALGGRQGKPARAGRQPARAPGEKRRRRSRAPARARRHARKAARLWRRHKARAAGYGLLALGGITGHGISRAYKGARKLRRRRS